MDKEIEKMLKMVEEEMENRKGKQISKDEMLEIIKNEDLEKFGVTVRI